MVPFAAAPRLVRLLALVLLVASVARPAAAQATDTDNDTMPDAWETFFGLNPNDPADAAADPDGDGLTNAQEFAAGRHPFGLFARYFAEGSTGFFDTDLAVLNLSTTATAHVSVALLDESGHVTSQQITLAPRGRRSVSLDTILGTAAAVSIIVESDVAIAADRAMTWGTSGVGLSLDSGAAAPATTWYFAEGATGPFLLYYLFENPGATAATVTVRYLRELGGPITKTRMLPPHSRTTVFVNDEDPGLAVSSLGAVVTSDLPILAERAMYMLSNGTFGGGSASSGSSTLSTQWYFGEGATGPFFHAFLSMINPGVTPATATVTYHLNDGSTASRDYNVPAAGRRTVYFNSEAESAGLAPLAHGPVWFTVRSTQPILGERAMWWSTWPWYEGHAAAGSTMSDVAWGVAEGRHGGPMDDQTYVLVGNTTTTAGQVRVSVIPDTGAVLTRDLDIAAGARLTLNIGSLFDLPESRFSVTVESLGATPVPLAVDYARYRSVNGLPFSGGGAAPAVPLLPADTPPSVTATTPADGGTGASSTNNLVVTFNEPVAAAAGAFTLACPTGTPIALTVVTASPASQFTLDPTVPLPPSTACTLTVLASAITDVDTTDPPDVMTANAVVTFTTAAENPPAVSSTTPAAGATQVGTAANPSITFSEPVDVAGNWFQIVCATSGTRGVADTVISGGPTTFTINPNVDFMPGELCTVTVVAAQVTDQDPIDPPDAMAANHVFSFTADVAPAVTATAPTNGATGLGTAASLSVTFSEPVTVTGNWFQIVCATSGTRIVADTVVSGGPTIFTIDPNTDFAAGELCTVTITAALVADLDAGDPPDTLAANVVFSFTIDTPPSVIGTTPADGATQVAANAAITVTFSEAVNAAAGNFTLTCTGTPVAFTLSASPAAAFTLTPTSPLPAGELCTIAIPPGVITDVDAGDPPDAMGASYVFSFTTDAAPSVTATTPTNGAISTTSTNLTVTFSEPVNVTGNWFQVVCGTSGTRNVADTAVTGGPTTFTINPNADFAGNETCTVTIFAAQVGDQDPADPPDAPAANFVFGFTTDAAPSVTSTTPANGATMASNTDVSVTFSEAVATAAGSYTLTCTTTGAHTFALSGGPTTWTLNPNADFTAGETCTLTVLAAGVTDQDASDPPDTMAANHVVTFTIDAAPSVTATTPANGAVQVATAASLALTFNEAVNVTGNWFQIVCTTTGTRNVIDTVVSGGPTAFSINPNVDFGSGETCTVTVFAAQVTDQDAIDPPDGMAADFLFSFTVDQAPGVTTTVPSNLATGVVPGTTITVNFTESVNATTSSFSVVCNGAPQAFTLSTSPATTFVLTPTSALPEGTICTVTVFAVQITDADAGDPPDNMLANHAFTFSIPPNAVGDARGATGNVPIDTATTGFSVLSNDIGPGIAVTAFDATSVRGGIVSVNPATGLFTYTPPVGYEGADSFNYTISNAAGSDTATVTVTVSNMVWFIDNTFPSCTTIAGGCGRRATPFSTLAAFEAVNGGVATNGGDLIDPEAGDHIFIASGGGAYTGPLTLEANQRVIGQGATSPLATLAGITLAPDSVSLPGTGGAAPIISGGGIALAANNHLHGLSISSGAAPGISGTGFGTLTVSENVAVTTTTGTAINLATGALTATFRSISANGGANGILVTNTTGSFTVTGIGATDGSGGTIQNTTTRGASFTTATNITLRNMNFTNAATADFPAGPTGLSLGANTADNAAIHLQNAANVVLDNLNINGSAEQGINGHNVNGFTLTNSVLANLGDGPDEDGLHFYNLVGTSAITNTTITSSGDDNVNIQNNNNLPGDLPQTTAGAITITGGSANTGVLGSGYLFGIRGTMNTTVTVNGVTSNDNFSGGVVIDTYDTATSVIEVLNSTLTNNNDGISLSSNNGSTKFDIHDNVSFAGTDFGRINVLKAAFSTGGILEGRIRNNPIVVADGQTTDGIFVFQAGGGTLRVAVTNNTIDYRGTQRPILLQGGQDGAGSLHATVTGNAIDVKLDGTGNAVTGLLAQVAVASPSGDSTSMCADIGGAGGLANVFTHSMGGTMGSGDLRLRQRFATTVTLPGYSGAADDNAAVAAYLAARNTLANAPAATATNAIGATAGAGGFVNGTCQAPVFP
jgi:methionine-rich copper-binding protein CopC